MITLPVDFGTDLMANVSAVFTDVSPVLLIAVGIPFGVYVIRKIISLIPKR
jgi:hypothetical protein